MRRAPGQDRRGEDTQNPGGNSEPSHPVSLGSAWSQVGTEKLTSGAWAPALQTEAARCRESQAGARMRREPPLT